jgi:hypothetical protein
MHEHHSCGGRPGDAGSRVPQCSAFKSTGVSLDPLSCLNTLAAPSRSWFF